MTGFAWVIVLLLVVGWVLHSFVWRKRQKYQDQLILRLYDEQAALEKSLELRSFHLDDILSAIHEPILRLARDGKVLSANPDAERLFSVRKFTALPQPMVAFYRKPDWLTELYKGLDMLPGSVDLPEIFIDREVFSPRLAALNGNEALLFFSNITKRYALQEQRKDFISNLMHDLKTPLTSLLGYARSIELFADDEALRSEAVGVICQEASHVSTLLDALLSVEQIEHAPADGAHCDIAMVCRQVWQALQPLMQDKDISLDLELSDEPVLVAMQEADCYRVVMNVASNAVAYTVEDSEISCCLNAYQLRIEDEGLGIPEKDLPHVIERFYRVDKSRGRGGHGLGLAIVQETLQRDGGQVELSNRETGGLQVLLQFPSYD
ncbi:MAG: ATP-binding protein [Mariprofundaceae bacterium]